MGLDTVVVFSILSVDIVSCTDDTFSSVFVVTAGIDVEDVANRTLLGALRFGPAARVMAYTHT